jgi:ATP-binding cassette subfamily B multidrug efflux pump
MSRGGIIKNATDYFAASFGHKISPETSDFVLYGLDLILLSLASGFFMFLMRQFIIVVSRLIEYDLKNEIYLHYQKLDLNFYKNNNTGDLMNRISEDVGKVRMYVGPAIMYIVNTIVTVATVIVFMLQESWQLTLVVILPLPVLSYIIFKVSNLINKRSTKVQEELSIITGSAQETFSGIRIVKAYNRENYYIDKFNQQSENYKQTSMLLARTEATFQPFMVFMVGLSLISIIYFGGKYYIDGIITIGSLPQFVFYVYNLTWPFAALGWVSSLVQRAAASQTRINEFLQTEPAIKNPSNESLIVNGKIEFKNVSFTYKDTNITALQQVSFTVESGQTLAVIGQTGSGKSTIANLVCRMDDVQQGAILIDGKNIKEVNLFDLRAQTGYVPQEVFLFSDTINNNISFSTSENVKTISSKIEQAAKDAAVYDNIIAFPKGFETVVGERGITLSGGQKQRISIARAIIKEPKILVFDDCLSAVDTETEDEILTNLSRVMRGRTSIIISHRISTVKHADKIIVLSKGTISEQGSHQELMNLKGEYYKLFLLQNLE